MAPRRASASSRPLWYFYALLLILLLAGGYWLMSWWMNPFRTDTPLPVQSYLENSNALRGNTYRVSGKVANLLGLSVTAGRLISVDVENSGDVVALLIPTAFNSVNIQKGQHFIFEIEVAEKGILRARRLQKA